MVGAVGAGGKQPLTQVVVVCAEAKPVKAIAATAATDRMMERKERKFMAILL
jgi:hypothetical protein